MTFFFFFTWQAKVPGVFHTGVILSESPLSQPWGCDPRWDRQDLEISYMVLLCYNIPYATKLMRSRSYREIHDWGRLKNKQTNKKAGNHCLKEKESGKVRQEAWIFPCLPQGDKLWPSGAVWCSCRRYKPGCSSSLACPHTRPERQSHDAPRRGSVLRCVRSSTVQSRWSHNGVQVIDSLKP